ncbi:MAG: glycosyltransferase family 39 protein [Elusimicrobia bacterium]|nr:glycosyltransferase family 39 protein [Elusimicrobiota bacterium]
MKKARLPLSPRDAALLLLLAAAAAVRLSGLTWGLPASYNADEPHIVHTALAYAGSFPRPYDFKYPALWPSLLFFCYGVYFLVWSCLGLCHKVSEFAGLYAWHPGGFFLIGRGLAASCSLLGPLLLARLEGSWRGRRWPWAALALAFAPVLVDTAHSCKPDCMMFLLACLAWVFAIKLYRDGSRGSHWLCGVFIGLAASTQYTAVPIALLLPAAHFLGPKSAKRRWLFEGAAASVAAFLLASPYTLLDFPRFWAGMKDFADLARQTPYDAWALRRAVGVNLWNFAGPGSIGGALAVVGLGRLALKERRLAFVLALPVAAQWLMVSRYPDGSWARYVLAAYPGLALLSAEAMDWALLWRRPLFTLLVSVLAFAPGILRCVWIDSFLLLPDTRPQAARWIKDNVPEGKALLLDLPHASPDLPMTKDEVEELEAKTRLAGSPRSRLYEGMAAAHPGGGYRIYRLRRFAHEMYSGPRQVEQSQADAPTVDVRPGLDTLRALRIDYVVTSNWGAEQTKAPELASFFEELYSSAEFVRDFIPLPGESSGPVLRVFKLSRQR